MKKFYQVCYGKPNSGWESFNYSEDVPAGAVSFFERAASNNTPENMDAAFVESGVDLFEIVSHNGYTEVSKVRYGLTDNVGRQMMFAHGFVFEAESGVLEDPNNVLAVSDSNFKFSKEETEIVPDSLKYDEAFDVASALDITGLTYTQIINTAAALHYSLYSSMNYQTYVVYRGTERQQKALLYLLISSVPYPLRHKLSFSTTDSFRNSMSKSVMVVDDIDRSERYIDLVNNGTNIALNEVNKYFDDFPFFDALKKYSLRNYDEYCRKMLDLQLKMGYPYCCSYNDLICVDLLLEYEESGCNIDELGMDFDLADEYSDYICSIASSFPFENKTCDDFLAVLLTDYLEKGFAPTEKLTQMVKQRKSASSSSKLAGVYDQLQICSIMVNGEEATLKFLKEIRNEDKNSFAKWAKTVVDSDKSEYVDAFFKSEMEASADMKTLSELWDELISINAASELREDATNNLYRIASASLKDQFGTENSFEGIFTEFEKSFKSCFGKDNFDLANWQILSDRFLDSYDIGKIGFSKAYFSNIKFLDKKNLLPDNYFFQVYLNTVSLKENDTAQARTELLDALKGLSKSGECSSADFEKLLYDKITPQLESLKNSGFKFWIDLAIIHGGAVNSFNDVIKRIAEWSVTLFYYESFERELNDARDSGELDDDWIYKLRCIMDRCEQFGSSDGTIQSAYAVSMEKQLKSFFKDIKKDEKRQLKEEKRQMKIQQGTEISHNEAPVQKSRAITYTPPQNDANGKKGFRKK